MSLKEIMDEAIANSIWAVKPIEEEPEVILDYWTIRKIESGTVHFVGYSVSGREGRVSSAIQEFDLENMKGKTRSGRVYQLTDFHGHNSDAEYVWKAWAYANSVTKWTDIVVDDPELESISN